MAYIQRRLISTVVFNNNTYASKPKVQAYVRAALTQHCADSGLDAQGADTAYVLGGAKAGGWFKEEPFHLTFTVYDGYGQALATTNPYTRKATYRHHMYPASSKSDLIARAEAWYGQGKRK